MKEGWKRVKLENIATDMYRGSGIKRDQVVSEGYPCVRYGEIYTSYNISFDKCLSHTIEAEIKSPKYIEHGDLIFAITGESVEEIGKTVAYLGTDKCLLGGDIVAMKHKQNPKFLSYALSTSDAIRQKGMGKTKLKVVHTSIPSLKEIQIPLPPLSEQQRIVEQLDSSFAKIDAVKEKMAKAVEEAKALFAAALREAMTPKEGWEEKKLGEVGEFKRGGNFSKKDFIEDGYPCIHYGQIHTKLGITTYQHLSTVPVEIVKPERCAKKGDLVIAITSEDNLGSCKCTAWMADFDAYVGGHSAIFHHSLDPIFMAYYFRSPRFQTEKLAYTHGFKVVEINPKDIAKIPISFPPLPEQERIVSQLDAVSAKVRQLEENFNKICEECDALKQAILRETFE